jgi:copper(I)-binding protein
MHDNASSPQAPKLRPQATRLARVVVTVAFSTMLAFAAPDAHALFIVNQPWLKPGIRATEAYMNLTSTEGATLIGVRSPIAAQAALRGPGAHGRVRTFLALPAGSAIALRPGSDHVALTGLARALKPGDRVALTLLIETAAGVRNESPLEAERRSHRH